jgi:hypothetical protein
MTEQGAGNAERRNFQRIAFSGPCELLVGADTYQCDVVDLSLKGAMITRPESWHSPKNELCTLRITLGDNAAVISMSADVTYEAPNRLGLHCHHIDLDSIAHLKRLMELNLGDPQLLYREFASLQE